MSHPHSPSSHLSESFEDLTPEILEQQIASAKDVARGELERDEHWVEEETLSVYSSDEETHESLLESRAGGSISEFFSSVASSISRVVHPSSIFSNWNGHGSAQQDEQSPQSPDIRSAPSFSLTLSTSSRSSEANVNNNGEDVSANSTDHTDKQQRQRETLLTDCISFDLPPDYFIASQQEGSSTSVAHSHNQILEQAKIYKEGFFVNVQLENVSSWVGVEEYVVARFFNRETPKIRKVYKFRDKYDAIVLQTKGSLFKPPPEIQDQKKKKRILTISIMLTPSLVISFQSIISSASDWDEFHSIVDSIHVEDLNPPGTVKVNAKVNSASSIQMQLPSVFCTTFEDVVLPIPKTHTASLYSQKDEILRIVSPLIMDDGSAAENYCGFSLYHVFTKDIHQFLERYQKEHAPAPEKIHQNLKVNNVVCRFFHYKCENHSFIDCIFQHPEFSNEIFILSMFVNKLVHSRQMDIYVSKILDCIRSIEFTNPVMMNIKTLYIYESTAYKFNMYLPSDSLIIENPIPLSSDWIVSVMSRICVYPKNVKRKISALCKTTISKCNRDVPEEEDPNPERLAELKKKELEQTVHPKFVDVGQFNGEWSTRYTYLVDNKFIVGTYIFYNASEIYLFETELMSNMQTLKEQVICFHNTISYA